MAFAGNPQELFDPKRFAQIQAQQQQNQDAARAAKAQAPLPQGQPGAVDSAPQSSPDGAQNPGPQPPQEDPEHGNWIVRAIKQGWLALTERKEGAGSGGADAEVPGAESQTSGAASNKAGKIRERKP